MSERLNLLDERTWASGENAGARGDNIVEIMAKVDPRQIDDH